MADMRVSVGNHTDFKLERAAPEHLTPYFYASSIVNSMQLSEYGEKQRGTHGRIVTIVLQGLNT